MSTESQFSEFDLLIGEKGENGCYPVRASSSKGERTSRFLSPYEGTRLTEVVEQLERGVGDQVFLETVGNTLFDALFSEGVRDLYLETIGDVKDGHLRLRLHIDQPELRALPWELLHYRGKGFLAVSGKIHVMRYLDVHQPKPFLVDERPLRILVAWANPTGYAHLSAIEEVDHICQALGSLQDPEMVTLVQLPEASLSDLAALLNDYHPHVFHYIGHGSLDLGKGALFLIDKHGDAHPVDDATLGQLLGSNDVRLAFLNACLTGREPPGRSLPSSRTAFLGVGPALIQAGLGAVVAMQFTVADSLACAFTEEFYRGLVSFHSLDVCVTRARQALWSLEATGRGGWVNPVLFMRSPNGVLLNLGDSVGIEFDHYPESLRMVARDLSWRWRRVSPQDSKIQDLARKLLNTFKDIIAECGVVEEQLNKLQIALDPYSSLMELLVSNKRNIFDMHSPLPRTLLNIYVDSLDRSWQEIDYRLAAIHKELQKAHIYVGSTRCVIKDRKTFGDRDWDAKLQTLRWDIQNKQEELGRLLDTNSADSVNRIRDALTSLYPFVLEFQEELDKKVDAAMKEVPAIVEEMTLWSKKTGGLEKCQTNPA